MASSRLNIEDSISMGSPHYWLLYNNLHLNQFKSEAIAFSTQGPNPSKLWLNPLQPFQLTIHGHHLSIKLES